MSKSKRYSKSGQENRAPNNKSKTNNNSNKKQPMEDETGSTGSGGSPPGGATPFVYIRSKNHAWVPGRVLESDGRNAIVVVKKYKTEDEMLFNAAKMEGTTVDEVMVSLKEYENGVLPMQNVSDQGKLGDYEDMVNLPYLHEAAILYNIKNRHVKGKPYTRTGDMVVAVNPYRWFDTLYTEQQRKLYAEKIVWDNPEEDPRKQLRPHVYEVSALSYKGLVMDNKNQSILVSGESGAGKTETVKICMNHIASVQEGPGDFHFHESKDSALVVQRVLDSNPLLEAFGNAKTRRNDNSSRFGKYTQLQFDRIGEVGRPVAWLAGSVCEVYLLEKNRVTAHDPEERTYHIFYQMLAACDEVKTKIWSGLKGAQNESFKYVGPTKTDTIEGVSDEDQFHRTLSVLQILGLDWGTDVRNFLRALCVVLQLGNLSFGEDSKDHDRCVITSKKELAKLADITEIPEMELTLALTERTMKAALETYKVPLSAAAAKESADALAKEIYGKMFLWLVSAINRATCAETNYPGGANKEFGVIGLLDIFGFESFETNRFEQLCINYANEKLQQKFTQDIFRSVQEEYDWEGIPLAEIKFDDNTDVLDLVEGETGLCALLNEECVRPRGSGAGFVNKALASNRKSACLVANRTNRLCFGIKHYAGKVFYDAENFVTSNMDTLATDLEDCATKCANPLIAAAFKEEAPEQTKLTPKRRRSNIMAPTVWTKYKAQLATLMRNLYATHSRYIRCIKPNTLKQPALMEHTTTVEQLRYAGIVAGVTISRSSFPNRLSNLVVYNRYKEMWDKTMGNPPEEVDESNTQEEIKAACESLLETVLKNKETVQNGRKTRAFVVGKTRAYFRAGALECLESKRITGLDAQATAIQAAVRGWLVRKERMRADRAKELEELEARRKEEERLARLERERKERDEKHREEMKKYLIQVQALRKKIQAEDDRTQQLLDAANERTRKAVREREALEQQLNDEVERQVMAYDTEMNCLKSKLASNMKLMEHLRRENKKAKKVLEKEEKQFKGIKKNHKRLSLVFDESFSTLGDLEESFNDLGSSNKELSEKREHATDEHRDLKDKVHKAQAMYMEMAEQRLEFQKTMAHILNCIGDDCTNRSLIDDAFRIAHDCEAGCNFVMEALEANPDAQFSHLVEEEEKEEEEVIEEVVEEEEEVMEEEEVEYEVFEEVVEDSEDEEYEEPQPRPKHLDESSRTSATWADTSDRSLTLEHEPPLTAV